MDWSPIKKATEQWNVQPNLKEYDLTCAAFSWESIRGEMEGLPGEKGINIAHEAVDRHADGPHCGHLALRWLASDGRVMDFTYGGLREQSNRFANILKELGLKKGERVSALTGRLPELYVAALGTLKKGGVFCPLFSAFGPDPIYQRLHRGDARVLVTTERLYREKVAPLRGMLPQLRHVLLVNYFAPNY